MIKFFRHIRKSLLMENKTGKYLKYAIGEIVLVVIGILIAVQINSWNQQRIQNATVENYFVRILDEIDLSRMMVKDFDKTIDTLITENQKSLEILNSNNRDSLIHLDKTIGALGTAYTSNLSFDIVDEYLNEGLLSKIEQDSLKLAFKYFEYIRKSLNQIDEYTNEQYLNSIEPFFYKNINYSRVVRAHNKSKLIIGGPETDYSEFYNNLEIYNLITFKLETLSSQKNRTESLLYTLDYLKNQIENYLENHE